MCSVVSWVQIVSVGCERNTDYCVKHKNREKSVGAELDQRDKRRAVVFPYKANTASSSKPRPTLLDNQYISVSRTVEVVYFSNVFKKN
jgi:hypothetical protein